MQSQEARILIHKIHSTYFKQIQFNQLDFLIASAPPELLQASTNKQLKQYAACIDKCLIYTEKAFDCLYGQLMKEISNENLQKSQKEVYADILMTMNGENQKAYNFRKGQIKRQEEFDYKKAIQINGAVLMKFKKTSSCYEYRFRLVQILLSKNKSLENILLVLSNENILLNRILQRFPRNYFCWMYRLKLFKVFQVHTNQKILYEQQIKNVNNFVSKNPNDYSALSYLRFIIRQINKRQDNQQILKQNEIQWKKIKQFCEVAYEPNQYKYLSQFIEQYFQKK